MSFYPKKRFARQGYRYRTSGKLGKGGRTKWRSYANRQRQFVPRTMGPFAVSESKYFDSFVNAAAISEGVAWTGTELVPATLNTLVVPTEGSDINNRIGRKISVYKIAIRGVIATDILADQGLIVRGPDYRIIVFCDKQTNGVQVQGETLMAAPQAATNVLAFSTFQNLGNLGRFRVLRDKIIRSPAVAQSQDNDNATNSTCSTTIPDIPFKFTLNFKTPVVMRFNSANGGTIGDIVDNSFHMIGIKTSTVFASTMSYQCRAYYKDA